MTRQFISYNQWGIRAGAIAANAVKYGGISPRAAAALALFGRTNMAGQ
jgi:hypothetical protein